MTGSRIGYIVYDRDHGPDALLSAVAYRLKAKGARVAGLLQDGQAGDESCCAILFLEDIGTGRRVQIYERRGLDTRGCRLDPAGLAEAAGWLREAIAVRPDVLFINRFGRQEAGGRGLVDEIGAAVVADIPVVVAVNAALLSEWHTYAGEGTASLPLDAERIEAWCVAQMAQAVPN